MGINRVQIQRGAKGQETMYVYFGYAIADQSVFEQKASMLTSAPPPGFAGHVDLPSPCDIGASYGPREASVTGLAFQVYVKGRKDMQVQFDFSMEENGDLYDARTGGPAAAECKIQAITTDPNNEYYALIIPSDL